MESICRELLQRVRHDRKRSDWLALQQGRLRPDTGKHFNGKGNLAQTGITTKSSRISEWP